LSYFDLTIILINILNKHNDNNTLIIHKIIKNIVRYINIRLIV